MRDDTVLFIITHQRAEKQLTLNYLKKAGYSGEIFLVVDNKDKDLEMYKKKYKDTVKITYKKDDFIMRISKTTLHPYIINQHYKKNGEKVSM